MPMRNETRDFDATDPLEKAISAAIADEGLVVWSVDHKPGAQRQRHLVAVVAGPDGPDLVCARAWRGTLGEVFSRIDLRAPVEAACRRWLPAARGSGLGLSELVPHLPDDIALAQAAGDSTRVLWKSSNGETSVYLVRMSPPGQEKELAAATSEKHDGKWSAKLHFSLSLTSFNEWAAAEFGPALPEPR